MKKLFAIIVTMLFAASLSLAVLGCKKPEDAANKVKEAANKATDKVNNATKEAATKVKDATKEAATKVTDAAKEATTKVKETANKAADKVSILQKELYLKSTMILRML